MPKVLVINKSCHDFSAAYEFGEVHYMTEGTMERFSTTKMFRAFKPFIDDSSSEDFILITGMTNMSVVVCSMFAAKHGRVNLLLYKEQRAGGRYIKRNLVFDN